MTLRLIPFALLSTALLAQGPGPRMHHRDGAANTTAAASYLSLTDAQIASLKQLRQSEMAALQPIFEQMHPLRQSLHAAQQASNPDATTVGNLVLKLQNLEQQAAPIRASFQQQAQAVLTADQKSKLTALQNAATLMPAVHQASALGLITPPEPPGGAPGGMFRGSHLPPPE